MTSSTALLGVHARNLSLADAENVAAWVPAYAGTARTVECARKPRRGAAPQNFSNFTWFTFGSAQMFMMTRSFTG